MDASLELVYCAEARKQPLKRFAFSAFQRALCVIACRLARTRRLSHEYTRVSKAGRTPPQAPTAPPAEAFVCFVEALVQFARVSRVSEFRVFLLRKRDSLVKRDGV